MPRTKAMTTRARELAKVLSPEQMKQLADLLAGEAEKPRVDRRQVARLERDFLIAHARARLLEEKLAIAHAAYGVPNIDVEAAIAKLKADAEKRKATLAAKPRAPRTTKKA
jgi:hypothetical protein